ncbi:MAG: hypothetical protein AAGB46_10710 [Verrucomicrobiota bacterium]
MAWRIDKNVVKGVIENRVPGIVTGRIWLKGLNKPVQLTLKGNAHRDLAGARLEFENPSPEEADYSGLDIYQDGVVGDLTASRKVKVPQNLEEYLENGKKGELKYSLSNCLYLEWFSESNGRVLIETTDFTWTIGLPGWQLSEADEDKQLRKNQEAMFGFMDQLTKAIDGEEDQQAVEESTGDMDEFQWEAYLQKSDAKSDMLMELFEKYEDDPHCEDIIAEAMGWEVDTVEYSEDPEIEWENEEEELEAPETEDEDYIPSHPLINVMMDITSRIFYEAESSGLLNDETNNPWNQLLWNSQMCVSKLIAALENVAEDVESEPGFVVATLKRALHLVHVTIATLEAAIALDKKDRKVWQQEIRKDLFEIRESILDLMQIYRGK